MTPQEFKAWFEGYAEGMEDRPSDKQWKRIKARVAEIDGRVTDRAVFVDRYWPQYRYWADRLVYGGATGIGQVTASTTPAHPFPVLWSSPVGATALAAASGIGNACASGAGQSGSADYEPAAAFNTLGRADALADA